MAQQPPKKPLPSVFDWRRQVLQMVVFVGFIAALGYAVSQGSFDYMSNAVDLTVEPNRTDVAFDILEPPVIQIHVKLKNNTAAPVKLTAPSPCKVLRWLIMTPAGEFVQSRGGDDLACADGVIENTLQPGQMIEEFYPIALLKERFPASGQYQAVVRYWGYEQNFTFSVKLSQ